MEPTSIRAARALGLIIAFKAFKSATLAALGTALLVTRRADPTDLLLRAAGAVHVPVTSALMERALTAVSSLTVGRQTLLALTAFGYSALMGTEAVALHLRKPWARWFTIIATASLIPLEIYELLREVHPIRIVVLVANVAIVVYLWTWHDLV
ncbi:MAG TPA: DUF2127 domain-containing protein [Vicinamibacterales bacterium]|nr:DUF2127 domain-containing protein [Vicinamibacterales bacterium]